MTTDTRKIVWRRQFNELKEENPELVEEKSDKMVVKYPVSSKILGKYRTLTTYNLFVAQSNSSVGDGVLKHNTAVVATKKPQGYKIGLEGVADRDHVLNALQVWSFCSTFRHYLGLYRAVKEFELFYDHACKISDELVYKLLTHRRQYPGNDLLTYLVNRTEEDFF